MRGRCAHSRTLQFLLMISLLLVVLPCCCSCELTPGGPSASSSLPSFRRQLHEAGGAMMLMPGVVDPATVSLLDSWLMQRLDHLPDFSVRKPKGRQHKLLRPSDAGGAVGEAVGRIAQHLHLGTAGLVELAAFVVWPGAVAQTLHRDRRAAGFVSCQLALHDVLPGRGGLAVMPGTLAVGSRPHGPKKRFPSHVLRGASLVRVCREPSCLQGRGLVELGSPAGSVVCYEGRLLHRGVAHRGARGAEARRVIYFTAWYGTNGGGRTGGIGGGLGEAALHPALRCAPLRHAPLLSMHQLLEVNASSTMCYAAGGGSD